MTEILNIIIKNHCSLLKYLFRLEQIVSSLAVCVQLRATEIL